DGAITLIGRDGIVRARGGPGAALGRDVSDTPLMRDMRAAPHGWTQLRSAIDGLDRLVSWREVRGFPLHVTVSMPEQEIYAAVTVKEQELRLSAAGMTLLIGFAIVLSSRHRIRLTRARGALAESERHASQKSAELEATLANMSQGIMMVDANRTVAVINRQAVDLLGLPTVFLHTRPRFDDILRWQRENGECDSEATALDEKTLASIRSGGIAAKYQVYERSRPDGSVLEIRSIPLAGGGVVQTYTDITERVRTQEALAGARDEAEAATRARTSFLAMMSHEMRTPLNGVIGMANLLIDTPLDDEQARFVSTLKASGEHLLMIISDILDLSKLEADRLDLEDIPFDLEATVGTVLEIVAPAAREKSLFIVAHIAADVPRHVRGDPAVLRQVLLNLVGNAVKFTPSGQVEVRVARGPEAEEGRVHLSFEVADTGIGIAADKLSALFHEFSQLDGSISRRFGGTGLGLAISRRLVERMGGWVSVDSEVGKGSTFRCIVVLAPTEDELSQPLLRDIPVLVVSAEDCVRPALARMLEAAGANVSQAADAQEAEAVCVRLMPRTVLVDESLGGGIAAFTLATRSAGAPM
ncbi:MAG: ATP-binding protein, partial [Alsobacter sp.]